MSAYEIDELFGGEATQREMSGQRILKSDILAESNRMRAHAFVRERERVLSSAVANMPPSIFMTQRRAAEQAAQTIGRPRKRERFEAEANIDPIELYTTLCD